MKQKLFVMNEQQAKGTRINNSYVQYEEYPEVSEQCNILSAFYRYTTSILYIF
jgi:hypothetical protein